jgi:hypothetical protein
LPSARKRVHTLDIVPVDRELGSHDNENGDDELFPRLKVLEKFDVRFEMPPADCSLLSVLARVWEAKHVAGFQDQNVQADYAEREVQQHVENDRNLAIQPNLCK